jgi:hypothetical protein
LSIKLTENDSRNKKGALPQQLLPFFIEVKGRLVELGMGNYKKAKLANTMASFAFLYANAKSKQLSF